MLRLGRLALGVSMSLLGVAVVVANGCGDGEGVASDTEPGPRLLAVGPSHACAWRQTGVYCWTIDFGIGGGLDAVTPVKVALDASEVVELAAASERACARLRFGQVLCWNVDERGPGTPVMVAGLDGARQLAVDARSACALVQGGSVACWGADLEHEPSAAPSPSTLPGLSEVVELRAGGDDSYCARTERGAVRCVSLAKQSGDWRPVALEVPALDGATAIAMTFADSLCGILPSSEVRCVKPDTGEGATLADSMGSVQLRASGGLSACAQDQTGRWHCWNVLTSGATFSSPKTDVSSAQPLIELGISGFILCGMQRHGVVVCAGANSITSELRTVQLPP